MNVAFVSQEIVVPYEECGHAGTARLGQTIVSNRLRWYRSISCPNCRHIEEDGLGLPPASLRPAAESGGTVEPGRQRGKPSGSDEGHSKRVGPFDRGNGRRVSPLP